MGKPEQVVSWVVYRMTLHGKQDGGKAVCEQVEWDAMELARPGHHALLRAGIGSEAEAERLARGSSGDAVPRGAPRATTGPVAVPAA